MEIALSGRNVITIRQSRYKSHSVYGCLSRDLIATNVGCLATVGDCGRSVEAFEMFEKNLSESHASRNGHGFLSPTIRHFRTRPSLPRNDSRLVTATTDYISTKACATGRVERANIATRSHHIRPNRHGGAFQAGQSALTEKVDQSLPLPTGLRTTRRPCRWVATTRAAGRNDETMRNRLDD